MELFLSIQQPIGQNSEGWFKISDIIAIIALLTSLFGLYVSFRISQRAQQQGIKSKLYSEEILTSVVVIKDSKTGESFHCKILDMGNGSYRTFSIFNVTEEGYETTDFRGMKSKLPSLASGHHQFQTKLGCIKFLLKRLEIII